MSDWYCWSCGDELEVCDPEEAASPFFDAPKITLFECEACDLVWKPGTADGQPVLVLQ
jgi:hypothetical protein